jgi:hypothetical protein
MVRRGRRFEWPEQAHLETEDRARYDPGREQAATTFVQRFASVR